jgi:hypothetical protein
MIEISLTYDFQPGIDQRAYVEYAKNLIGVIQQAPGLIEFRAHRNMLGSPQIRGTSVWQTLGDWVKFLESAKYQALEAELRSFVTNLRTEIWGPSPVVPEPIRPGR